MSKPCAFILGYTGATGKALVKELAKDSYFGRVVLIGRREVQLEIENDGKFEQKVVDYDNLGNFEEAFRGCEAGFCCLGTTRATAGKEHFIKVDRDYVISSGKVAKAAGCKHYTLVSSSSADKNSMFLYLKTKGEAEDGIRQLGFERYSIFRPGLLLADRGNPRLGEKIYRCFLAPFKAISPTRYSIPVEILARGMLNNAKTAATQLEEAYDNSEAYRLAQGSEKKKS